MKLTREQMQNKAIVYLGKLGVTKWYIDHYRHTGVPFVYDGTFSICSFVTCDYLPDFVKKELVRYEEVSQGIVYVVLHSFINGHSVWDFLYVDNDSFGNRCTEQYIANGVVSSYAFVEDDDMLSRHHSVCIDITNCGYMKRFIEPNSLF